MLPCSSEHHDNPKFPMFLEESRTLWRAWRSICPMGWFRWSTTKPKTWLEMGFASMRTPCRAMSGHKAGNSAIPLNVDSLSHWILTILNPLEYYCDSWSFTIFNSLSRDLSGPFFSLATWLTMARSIGIDTLTRYTSPSTYIRSISRI
jgi:hypothetical protein